MKLIETVKNFLRQPEEITNTSSQVDRENVLKDLTNQDLYPTTGAFFDDDNNNGVFGASEKADKLEKEKAKILSYRSIAKSPDINDALEEIVNEIMFSLNDKEPIKIDIDEENEKIEQAITEKFTKILKLMNVRRNLYSIVKSGYVDGQIIMHHPYKNKNTKEGIESIKMIEPIYFYFDGKKNVYKYYEKRDSFYQSQQTSKTEEYSIEEITKEDFGLHEDGINLSYLEYALKPANQLRTLEDLLIPMRFSRSISRRVFNVDIGDLPNRKGEEVMREMQGKFKYKKFYNIETGEVTNQQHVTSMVEDYWFANRSGGKGTQVDVIDETGNLGELNDILYFSKKLYKAMYIPSNRISVNPDEDKTWDYDSTQVTKEDVKFFMFVSRARIVYTSLLKEILKKEVVSTGVMSEEEWDEYEEKIEISFVNENQFIERMNLDNFMKKLDIYATAQEYQGKLFSVEYILKEVFKLSDEEIKERLEEIQKEESNPLFKKFYASDEDEESW